MLEYHLVNPRFSLKKPSKSLRMRNVSQESVEKSTTLQKCKIAQPDPLTSRSKITSSIKDYQGLSQKKRNSPDIFNQRIDNQQGFYPTPSPLPIQERAVSNYQPQTRMKTTNEKKSLSPLKVNKIHRRLKTDNSEIESMNIIKEENTKCSKNSKSSIKKDSVYRQFFDFQPIKIEKCKSSFPNIEPLQDLESQFIKVYRKNRLDQTRIDQIMNRIKTRSRICNLINALRDQCSINNK